MMRMGKIKPAPLAWMMLVAGLMSGVVGCGDDLYDPCELDASSEDVFVRECAQDTGNRSCSVEGFLQCQTRICARYEGSDAFCTVACQSDADCPAGQCREFVLQTGRRYCVRNEDIK